MQKCGWLFITNYVSMTWFGGWWSGGSLLQRLVGQHKLDSGKKLKNTHRRILRVY